MEREEGVIEKVQDRKALVRVLKSSHCAACESRGSCHVFGGQDMQIEVNNDLHAKVGDHVEISMPTGSLLKLSVLVYLLPVVALIVGAYAGGAWASSFHADPTVASVIGGAFAVGAAFYGLKRLDRSKRDKSDYAPRMRRIMISACSPQPADSRSDRTGGNASPP
jgi:sigma-E factor negative regulatory protein RseC